VHSTTAGNGIFPRVPRDAAEVYVLRGLAPIPMPPRTKDPGYPGWEALRLTVAELDRYFPRGESKNIGNLNGAPSHNTADVDLDCLQALQLAERFLPDTGWIFGRRSAPRSHWVYQTDTPLDTAQEAFEDTDGTMLLELRGTGGLTVFPPSVHKDGEPIEWDRFDDPAQVRLADLQAAARKLAAAALLSRHWPNEGNRDKAAMALHGGLARAGWTAEDAEAFVEAVAVAAGDDEVRMRAGKAERTADKAKDGDKLTGWPRLMQLLGQAGEAIVRRALDWLGIVKKDSAAAEPIPIPDPPPWPDPPAEEAFYGLAGRIVHLIEPASEADPAALLIQVLVAFGNAVGRGAYFTVEADRHHANEFAVLVGKTSKARKGTSWGQVFRLFREVDESWAAERVQSGLSSSEGLIWAVRDPIKKREKVKNDGQVCYEEVEADPGIDDKRLLAFEAEFANVLKQTERLGNTLSVVLRQAWDGLDLRTLVKNSPARATGAHVSLVGHITADELRRYLTATETANGFGNRHLWICADRSKRLPEGGQVDPGAWIDTQKELVAALEFARSAGEMRRDEEARVIWHEVYGPLSEGRPGLAGALLARAEAHVMRLAMLYALLDCSASIRAVHLLAALALWDYAERSVTFVFGDCLGDPVADELQRLLRACPGGLTRTDISGYFQRNVSADRIARALGLLLQHNLARVERQETGGRPSERWFGVVNPSSHRG
jgi:hypothetical protein